MPGLDLDLIRTFVSVSEHRDVTTAAQALGVTQPAVTRKLRRLELVLETRLFDRSRRPMALTSSGLLLKSRAPGLIDEANNLIADIRTLHREGRGNLCIGMPDSLSEIMGAEIVSVLTGLARKIELRSGTSPWLESAFHSGNLDLAVDSPPFRATRSARTRILFNDPIMIAVPGSWRDRPITECVEMENFVAYSNNSKFGMKCAAAMRQLGVRGEARFALDSTQSLLRFVQAGYGWTITSALCLLQSPKALRELRIQPCPDTSPRTLYLLHNSKDTTEIAEPIAQSCRSVFRQLLAAPWKRLSRQLADELRRSNPDADQFAD